MIFDEMGHMMDWFTPNIELIFIGVISFIIIVAILLFLLNRHTNREYLDDTIDTITLSGKREEFKPSETTKYCPECGSKLDARNSKFCPLCGTRL